MQAGTLDTSHSVDYGHKSRSGANGPVVGASQATPTAASATGAQVELATVAVSLATATSASAELRSGETATAPPEPPPESKSAAASVQLSAEAQRLALIPAQVMDAEEVAQAREEVVKAQEKLAEVRTEQRKQADETSLAQSEEKVQQAKVRAATNGQAGNQSEGLSSPMPTDRASRIDEPRAETESNKGTAAPASVSSGTAQATATQRPARRPDQSSVIHGRSPFESSVPRVSGQSFDIVVGGPAAE